MKKNFEMDDINWFCDIFGLNVYWYQKVFLKMIYGDEIAESRKILEKKFDKEKKF